MEQNNLRKEWELNKIRRQYETLKNRYDLLLEAVQNVCQEVLGRPFEEPVIEKPKSVVKKKKKS